jgi:ATP-dependent DNA helicase RecQ
LGRAARDGEPAIATLHYRPEDLGLRRYFATKRPDADDLGSVIDAVAGGARRRADIAAAAGIPPRRVAALLVLLADVAALRIDRRGAALRPGVERRDAIDAALERADERERIDRSRIDMLRGYAETRRCRRQVLLGYFGQELPEPCGNCDTCADGSAYDADAPARDAASPTAGDAEYAIDERVRHREWGEGTVVEVEDDRLTVFFEAEGYKVLSRDLVREHDLLER